MSKWTLIGLTALSVACGGSPQPQPSAPAAPQPAAPAVSGPQLMTGLGDVHHSIATTIPQAQKFFDQGCALVYAFNHEEAVRSFRRAAELDPKAAMPQWGIAWALGPNYNLDIDDPRAKQASEAIAAAKSLAAGSTASNAALKREYVDAMAVRYSPGPKADRAVLARTYSKAMGALMRRHPDDLDAATLYAESLMNLRPWKLWTLEGKPAEDTLEIVVVLESVLRRDPNHVGANHYYIHTVEASPNPWRALSSAKHLESLVPAAGHLVHMPAHIYARTGDHAAAARANLAGVTPIASTSGRRHRTPSTRWRTSLTTSTFSPTRT